MLLTVTGAVTPLRQEADAIIAGTINGSYHAFAGPRLFKNFSS